VVAILYFVVGVLAIIGLVTCFKAFLDWLDSDYQESLASDVLREGIELANRKQPYRNIAPAPNPPSPKASAKRKPSKRVKK
jgi:hypothetical protein